jgi:hypothetical protein
MRQNSLSPLAWQALICIIVLSIWQWGYQLHTSLPWLVPDLLDPYFISKPSEIFEQFLILSCLKSKLGVFNGWFNGDFAKCMARTENNLWVATAVTLKNTFFGFVTGVTSGALGPAERDLSTVHHRGEFNSTDCARTDHCAGLRHRRHLQGRDLVDRGGVSRLLQHLRGRALD